MTGFQGLRSTNPASAMLKRVRVFRAPVTSPCVSFSEMRASRVPSAPSPSVPFRTSLRKGIACLLPFARTLPNQQVSAPACYLPPNGRPQSVTSLLSDVPALNDRLHLGRKPSPGHFNVAAIDEHLALTWVVAKIKIRTPRWTLPHS
jgi:hypothetical protein